MAEAGCLIAFGPSVSALYHRAATYVDRILRGRSRPIFPSNNPRRSSSVINLKTAKALGLTIPPSLLLRADQVIE